MRIKIFMLVTAVVLLCCSGVATAAPKTYCEELKGTDTGQACQIQMSDPAYNINISLPSYYPDQKSLENYIAQTRDKFLSAATSSTPREAPYELNITSATYQSAIPPRGTQAVVLKVYQNAGGTHPTTTYKAFDWDQAYRKPITYDTLWQADTDPLPVVFPIVQGELSKQTGQQVSIAPNAGLDPVNYQNFAVTNDGVIFFFNPGELLPEAAGPTQVLVPRSAIDSMLARSAGIDRPGAQESSLENLWCVRGFPARQPWCGGRPADERICDPQAGFLQRRHARDQLDNRRRYLPNSR